MATLDELVRDLLDRYKANEDDDEPPGPGLMARLDDLALRTSQPHTTGGHSAPGSRPPVSLDAVHWSVRIKTEAIVLDMELRGSPRLQTWHRAMRAIPPNAEAADRVKETSRTVGAWHGSARTVLGLRPPSMHFEHVLCLACGERTVHGRADDKKPRAWCTNDQCVDGDTGKPARYEGDRLYLLTRSRAT